MKNKTSIRLGRCAVVISVSLSSLPAFAQEEVVARVGDTEITESDLAVAEALFPAQTQGMSRDARRSLIVDNLIDLQLVVQAAEDAGLHNDPAYRQRIEFLADQTLGSLYLERQITEAVTDELVRREYDRVVEQMPETEEIRPKHILVSDREKAQDAITRLDRGEDFAAIARDVSLDEVSKPQGGDLGFVQPDTILKEISDAAAALDVGAYTTEPVESPFGFHVVMLTDRRQTPAPDFAAIGPQIRQSLRAAAMQRITSSLREAADVEKLILDVESDVSGDGHQH